MKKKILNYALLPLLAIGLLTGCNDSTQSSSDSVTSEESSDTSAESSDEGIKEVETESISHDFKGIMEQNATELKKRENNYTKASLLEDHSSELKAKGYTFLTNGNELIDFIQNEEGYVGVYNKVFNKIIYACQFYSPYIQAKRIYKEAGIVLASIIYDGEYILMDSFGNVFLKIKDYEDVIRNIRVLRYDNDTDYFSIIYRQNGMLVEDIYHYVNGKAVRVSDYPEMEEENKFNLPIYSFNDLFSYTKAIKLDQFGLAGYTAVVSERSLLTVYDNNNNVVNTSFLETKYGALISHYYYYQTFETITDENIPYTYYGWQPGMHGVEGSIGRYDLNTYKLDILTGKLTEIVNFNYVINQWTPFKDNSGFYNLGALSSYKILPSKTLDRNASILIINSNNEILRDYKGYLGHVNSMYKFNDSYYESENKILYDKNFNIIANLSGCDVEICVGKNLLIVHDGNGVFGAIDSVGKVVIPFEYDRIYAYDDADHIIAVKDDNVYFFDGNSENATKKYLNGHFRLLNDGYNTVPAFVYETLDETFIFNNDQVLYHGPLIHNLNTRLSLVECDIPLIMVKGFTVEKNISGDDVSKDVSFNIIFTDKQLKFTTNGTESHAFVLKGSGFNDAIRVRLGDNGVHIANRYATSNYTYLSFTPDRTGAYRFEFNTKLNINIYTIYKEIKDASGNSTYGTVSGSTSGNELTINMQANNKYFVVVYAMEGNLDYNYVPLKISFIG